MIAALPLESFALASFVLVAFAFVHDRMVSTPWIHGQNENFLPYNLRIVYSSLAYTLAWR